jgi:hypothetical protein
MDPFLAQTRPANQLQNKIGGNFAVAFRITAIFRHATAAVARK